MVGLINEACMVTGYVVSDNGFLLGMEKVGGIRW